MSQIRSTEVLERVEQSLNGNKAIATEDGYFNQTKPNMFIGNGVKEIIEPCGDGICRVIKSISIVVEGNSGTVKLKVNDTVLLPLYVNNATRAKTAMGFRYTVKAGETVTAVLEGRGEAVETFIAITYYNTNA